MDVREKVTKLSDYMHAMYFRRCDKRGFSDVLTGTLIMHFDETRLVLSYHVVRAALRQVAARFLLFAIVDAELGHWGSIIRRRFVLDNLLALPVDTVHSGLDLVQRFIGVHTFEQSLDRLMNGYCALLKN